MHSLLPKNKMIFHKPDFFFFPDSMLVFRNAELEHEHSVDGSAILQVFEEKMGF